MLGTMRESSWGHVLLQGCICVLLRAVLQDDRYATAVRVFTNKSLLGCSTGILSTTGYGRQQTETSAGAATR
jgi:hypothetical protein